MQHISDLKARFTKEKVVSALQQTMFPKVYKCIFCGREIYKDDGRYATCNQCFSTLPYRLGEYCLICGDPIVEHSICKRCRELRPDFCAMYAPFEYSRKVSAVLVSFKDKPNVWMAPFIANYMADWYNTFKIKGEIMVYVPSSEESCKRRKFDHNKLVCNILTELICVPIVEALVCLGMPSRQSENDRELREINVLGAFSVLEDKIKDIENKDIILVDDVVTTGATARECARVLMKNGKAKSVRVLAFARR